MIRILVTQGERAGIGPEVVVRTLAAFLPASDLSVMVVGDPEDLARTAGRLRLPVPADVVPVSGPSIALAALEEAARRAAEGAAEAVVTAPVNKARLMEAGFGFPGQTEFFAARLGAADFAMMLAAGPLRVVPVTTHLALRDVPRVLTTDLVARRVRTTATALVRDFGIAAPRIAVLGLNPHAGEQGRFGDEEARVILPALEALRAEGLDVAGPLPADAVFPRRSRSAWDAVVGMFHDQVLGPFKALADGAGVNVTLGLPAVRTSPDHGTAEDIAGKGLADATSMTAALELACGMARRRKRG